MSFVSPFAMDSGKLMVYVFLLIFCLSHFDREQVALERLSRSLDVVVCRYKENLNSMCYI